MYEWIVVMKPRSMPNASCSTFTMGTTQFVVHEPGEMMWCFEGSYCSSLTPRITIQSSPFPGADRSTFFTPSRRWRAAEARSVNSPVDSTTTST